MVYSNNEVHKIVHCIRITTINVSSVMLRIETVFVLVIDLQEFLSFNSKRNKPATLYKLHQLNMFVFTAKAIKILPEKYYHRNYQARQNLKAVFIQDIYTSYPSIRWTVLSKRFKIYINHVQEGLRYQPSSTFEEVCFVLIVSETNWSKSYWPLIDLVWHLNNHGLRQWLCLHMECLFEICLAFVLTVSLSWCQKRFISQFQVLSCVSSNL